MPPTCWAAPGPGGCGCEGTRICEQIWGGVGFTIEYDIQLFFRRAKQLQLSWWDSAYLEELIAVQELDA